MDLSKGYLLAKILLCVLLISLGLLELSYGTSGPKFYIYKTFLWFYISFCVFFFYLIYLWVFSRFIFEKNYLLLSCATSVRPSVCRKNYFRGISISNRPINLKMSMNVRKWVVHFRKA